MSRITFSKMTYGVSESTLLQNAPDFEIHPPDLKLPGWAKWILRYIVRPVVPAILGWLSSMMPTVLRWIWKIADSLIFDALPDEVPPEVIETVQEWLRDLEDTILGRI